MVSTKGLAKENEVVELLRDMVRIDSVNTLFGKGGGDEDEMVEYICNYCDKHGFEYSVQEVKPTRKQVLVHVKGSGEGAICFEAHTDTVPADDMIIDPFDPVIKDGKIYGRGSCDCKGSVAAMLYALKLMKDNNIVPYCDVYFCAAAEEEFSYTGVLRLLEENIHFDAAVVGEPTGNNILSACKGCCRFKIVTRGKTSHSSKPWEGKNAVIAMAHVITELEAKLFPIYEQKIHPLLGPPTFSISIINGGQMINQTPDYCEISIDRRMLPGDTYDTVKNDIETALADLRRNHPEYEIEVLPPFVTDIPFATPTEEKIVQTAAAVCDSQLGYHEISGGGFGCDASKLKRDGIPSIVMGPGSVDKAHTLDEFVPIAELIQSAEIFAQICVDFRP